MSKKSWALGLILLAVFAAYGPAITGSFLVWDDNRNIYHNLNYQPLTWESLGRFWYEPYEKTFRPLIYTIWGVMSLAARFFGPSAIPGDGSSPFYPGIFHAANLVLHSLNVVLVWLLARRFIQATLPLVAATLLFALHPFQVESVAWVTGFNELLCATLCLACTAAFLNFVSPVQAAGAAVTNGAASGALNQPSGTCYALRQYGLATVFYALALLVKPATVALPLVLLVLVWATERASLRMAFLRLLPWLGAGILFSGITSLSHPDTYSGQAPPLWARFFIAGDALAFYLAKLAWPLQLCLDYGRKPEAVLGQWWIWFSWLLPASLCALAWTYRKRTPWPAVALLAMLGWLLPVCGLKPFHFQLQFSTVADRYMYFALFPMALALGMILEQTRLPRRPLGAVVVAAGLFWGILSFRQTLTWRTNFTAFSHVLAINPASWMANANIGAAYDNEGDKTTAARHFQAALKINPRLWQMHVMLGRYALAEGKPSLAIHHYRQALALKPGQMEAKTNLEKLGVASP